MVKYFGLIWCFILAGCTVYNSCRPMQVGMKWNEWEIVRNEMTPGRYDKICVYTEVFINGEYQYDCEMTKHE